MNLPEYCITTDLINSCETEEELSSLCNRIAVDLTRYGCSNTMRYMLRRTAKQRFVELRLEKDFKEASEDDWGGIGSP